MDVVGVTVNGVSRRMDMFDHAIGHDQAMLEIEIDAARGGARDGLLHKRPVVGMHAPHNGRHGGRGRRVEGENPVGFL